MNLAIFNGATRGLGCEMTKQVVDAGGSRVVCLVRDAGDLGELEPYRARVELFQCDYARIEDAAAAAGFIGGLELSRHPRVRFVNNVATIAPIARIGDIETADLVRSMRVNVVSNFLVVNALVRAARRSGVRLGLLNISSGVSHSSVPGLFLYGAGKSYLDYLTLALATECADDPLVRVATFYPGGMRTGMQDALQQSIGTIAMPDPSLRDRIIGQPLANPAEIAGLVVAHYFASDDGWRRQFAGLRDLGT